MASSIHKLGASQEAPKHITPRGTAPVISHGCLAWASTSGALQLQDSRVRLRGLGGCIKGRNLNKRGEVSSLPLHKRKKEAFGQR